MTIARQRWQADPLRGDSHAGDALSVAATLPGAGPRSSAADVDRSPSRSTGATLRDGPSSASRPLRFFSAVAWINLAVVVAAWAVMHWGADRWWWATVLSFLPRWLWAAPLAVLVPITLFRPRRLWLVTSLTALSVAWPLMGFCGVRSVVGGAWSMASGESAIDNGRLAPNRVRVLTCNVGLAGYDRSELATLIAETDPDLIALEEDITAEELAAARRDFHVTAVQGIAVASRWPIVDSQTLGWPTAWGPRPIALRVRCQAPAGDFDFVALHLCSPRKGLEAVKWRRPDAAETMQANTNLRRAESAKVTRWLETLPGPVIVAGDLNMPPESQLFKRDWNNFTDAFAIAGWGYGYTYGYTTSGWFYGIRIDHILADAGWNVECCRLGRHIGSDHRPVAAELVRVGSG